MATEENSTFKYNPGNCKCCRVRNMMIFENVLM